MFSHHINSYIKHPVYCINRQHLYSIIYIYFACLSVYLHPINVKTAESIGLKFCVGPYVTPGKRYGWSKFKKFAYIKIRFLKFLKSTIFFCFVFHCIQRNRRWARSVLIKSSIYLLCSSVWVSVCMCPINVKTTETDRVQFLCEKIDSKNFRFFIKFWNPRKNCKFAKFIIIVLSEEKVRSWNKRWAPSALKA